MSLVRFTVFSLFILLITPCFCFAFFAEKNSAKRNHIMIVGSSTVYPFTTIIAEKFGKQTKFRTPTVEATGTGGGLKLFCSGIGFEFPDFVNASRHIALSEIAHCKKNGITKIGEIKIGYDGIVLANSVAGKKFSLSKRQIFLALAKQIPYQGRLIDNPFHKWNEIDPNLPAKKIIVYGPPPSSGTRDSFAELVMEKTCINIKDFAENYPDVKMRQKKCQLIRDDGAFIEAGENDNLILQKLQNDHDALGIFGFNFLAENKNSIHAATIDNIEPTINTIANSQYEISRPLFIYFKGEHFDLTLGMHEFVNSIISKDVIGNDGYLMQKGLVALSDLEIKKMRDEVSRHF